MEMIGIDVGGTGIKAAVVETDDAASSTTARVRVETPHPADAEGRDQGDGRAGRRACREPARGHRLPRRDPRRRRQDRRQHRSLLDRHAGRQRSSPTRWGDRSSIGNDADAAGLAEMRFGAGRGQAGTVLMLTLGTGIGSALFRDGVLAAEHRARAPAAARQGRRAARRSLDQGQQGPQLARLEQAPGRVRRRSSTRCSGPIS